MATIQTRTNKAGRTTYRVGFYEAGRFQWLPALAREAGANPDRLHRVLRYLAVIAVGVPIWYAVGILFTSSPELGAYLGVTPKPE